MSEKNSIFDQLRAFFGKKTQTPPAAGQVMSAPTPLETTPPVFNTPSAPQLRSQSPEIQPAQPSQSHSVDLILGIDFGTSCTKAVIGDPGLRAKSYPVTLVSEAQGLSQFLKPSRLKFRTSEGADRIESNLKMRLMDYPKDEKVRQLAILYLAGVIRQSIAWFEPLLQKNYTNRQPVWSLNLGFPAKAVDSTTPLVQSYLEVARLAALLGSSDLPIDFSSLHTLASGESRSSNLATIPQERVQLYPEIAAQLAGYVNSPYRQRGNLLLIDVGAGTLDVSTIILHGNDNEDVISFHSCEVESYGVFKLFQRRIDALEISLPKSVRCKLDDFQEGTSVLPEKLDDLIDQAVIHIPANAVSLKTVFDDVSKTFAENSIKVAIRCITQFRKRQRDAHASRSFEPFPNYLRFIFTGGGSRSAFYRNHFTAGPLENALVSFTRWHEDAMRRRSKAQGLLLESLPLPNDLEGFPASLKNEFDRLSVAHGLAYGGENLMRVTASAKS